VWIQSNGYFHPKVSAQTKCIKHGYITMITFTCVIIFIPASSCLTQFFHWYRCQSLLQVIYYLPSCDFLLHLSVFL
jgi:hypothetical protein